MPKRGVVLVAMLTLVAGALVFVAFAHYAHFATPRLEVHEVAVDPAAGASGSKVVVHPARMQEAALDLKEPELDASAVAAALKTTSQDPFEKWLVGFPTKALTVAELKLCDARQTIFLKDSWECAEDPSCLSCRPKQSRDRFKELQTAFRDPELQSAREASIQQWFPVKGQTVVTFAFNFAHSDLFLNWACSVEKLGLDPREFTLVAPCDDQAEKAVRDLGFHYVDAAWTRKLARKIKPQESFWGGDHADINNVALFLMRDTAKLGYQVFVQDADVAWLQDPRPFLRHAIERRDFIAMLAPFWTSMGPVNTGFIYIAPTQPMLVFLESMENAAEVKDTSDQRLWNTVLRHFVFQQLSWRLLPQEVIYKYSGRHAKKPGPEALVFHAVGSQKRRKLSDFALWLLKPTCRFYNAESAKLNNEHS